MTAEENMSQELSALAQEPVSTPQPASEPARSRRDALLGLTSVSGLMAMANAEAQTSSSSPTRTPETQLIRRTTYGATPADLALVTQLGFNQYLEKQLTMTDAEDSVCETFVKNKWPAVFMKAKQLSTLSDGWIIEEGFKDATIYRSIFSKRQLYQRMCEFWRDHFNMYIGKVGFWQFIPDHNDVIRKHALGKFSDMLWASAHSAGMMVYLDNAYSYGGNPNQNYAREIMELHTMGVTGGYTQQDVVQVTNCFTGWSYLWDPNSTQHGEWKYVDWAHAEGSKYVLGRTIPAGGGVKDAELVMRILLTHPSTAKFLAKKMVRWFLGEGNFATVETKVANEYLRTGGDIKAMLRIILTGPNLMAAQPKLKRPGHLYISALAALKPKVDSFSWMRWGYMNTAGQELFGWPTPDGFPDKTSHWQGLLLPRWNFFFQGMSGGFTQQFQFDIKRVIGTRSSAQAVVDKIEQIFFSTGMPVGEKTRLINFVKKRPITDDTVRETVALALCFPSYQWF